MSEHESIGVVSENSIRNSESDTVSISDRESDTVSEIEHENGSSTSSSTTFDSQSNSSQASNSQSVSSQASQKNFSSENVIKHKFITGKRRDRIVLHSIDEKQLYVKNKQLSDGSIAYTCREKKCNARVYMLDGVCYSIQKNSIHNPENKEVIISEMLIEAEIKKSCAEMHPSSTPKTSQISDVREIFNNSMVE